MWSKSVRSPLRESLCVDIGLACGRSVCAGFGGPASNIDQPRARLWGDFHICGVVVRPAGIRGRSDRILSDLRFEICVEKSGDLGLGPKYSSRKHHRWAGVTIAGHDVAMDILHRVHEDHAMAGGNALVEFELHIGDFDPGAFRIFGGTGMRPSSVMMAT
jgi:hypothetical protein